MRKEENILRLNSFKRGGWKESEYQRGGDDRGS